MPIGQEGEAKELLGTMLWLGSPASHFVAGVIVPVDGGIPPLAVCGLAAGLQRAALKEREIMIAQAYQN